jgi:hypothetical protein
LGTGVLSWGAAEGACSLTTHIQLLRGQERRLYLFLSDKYVNKQKFLNEELSGAHLEIHEHFRLDPSGTEVMCKADK